MSMKSTAMMLMAMTGLMGGGYGMPSIHIPQPTDKDKRNFALKKMTNEEREELFGKELDKYNAETATNFPKWKVFNVEGIEVRASNLKNAHKQLRYLIGFTGLWMNKSE